MKMQTTRLGIVPSERTELNQSGGGGSPDIIRIGDPSMLNLAGTEGMKKRPIYLVIGTVAKQAHLSQLDLPVEANVAAHEAAVFVPEEVILDAAKELLARETGVLSN